MDTNQLIDQLSAEAVPVQAMANPWLLTAKWLLGFAIYMAVILMVVMPPRDDIFMQLQHPLFALEIVMLFAMLVSCALSAALLAFPDMYQARRVAQLPLICFGLFALVVGYAFVARGEAMPLNMAHCACTALITAFALPPGIYLFYSIRRFASTHAMMAGSVAVLTAFSMGALALRLIEKTDSIAHVLGYHYVPMFGFALIGMVLGRKLLRW